MSKWAYGHMGICEKIWPSGVSPKKASKIQLRDVDLRSVRPSVKKLWPTTFFAWKMPCILHYNAKKIRNTISRQVRDLVQKAKWSEIFRRSRIQALPTILNNLWQSEKVLCPVCPLHPICPVYPVHPVCLVNHVCSTTGFQLIHCLKVGHLLGLHS